MPQPSPTAIVLIEVDENSRLRVLQSTGVRIGFIDYRVEKDALTIMPEIDQIEDILVAISGLHLISPKVDDAVKTAAATILRIGSKSVIVARGLRDE